MHQARLQLLVDPNEQAVFVARKGERFEPPSLTVTRMGERFEPPSLTELVRELVKASGIDKKGSCHLLRHTMATLMLDGGADLRFIQELLGHSDPKTTQIYTQVSIRKLQQIHAATHPGALLQPGAAKREQGEDALLSSLAAEAEDEGAVREGPEDVALRGEEG